MIDRRSTQRENFHRYLGRTHTIIWCTMGIDFCLLWWSIKRTMCVDRGYWNVYRLVGKTRGQGKEGEALRSNLISFIETPSRNMTSWEDLNKKMSTDLSSFKQHLKTHLFNLWFEPQLFVSVRRLWLVLLILLPIKNLCCHFLVSSKNVPFVRWEHKFLMVLVKFKKRNFH